MSFKFVALMILSAFIALTLAEGFTPDEPRGFLETLLEIFSDGEPEKEVSDGEMNLRPIIGIIAKPTSSYNSYTTFIMAAYSKFAQAGGARVIPIPFDLSEEEIKYRMEGVNGLIIPGGADWLMYKNNSFTEYTSKVKLMVDHAKRMNNEGNYFPVFGIWLGFEQLVLFEEPHYEIFGEYDSKDYPASLKFEVNTKSTILFQNIDENKARDYNLTYNQHFRGFNESLFTDTPSIKKTYQVTSTSVDRDGK